jgi:membrane associated rhomboid family serine protease
MVNLEEHPLTWGLIIANVLVFILVFSLPNIEAVFNAFSFSFDTRFEVWRWFTSLFLHVSASHLFFNMLGLFFFGKVLEKEVNRQWFLSIYFVSGLLGNFVYMFTAIDPVVGASGCVFGVMGAAMLLNPIKRIHLYLFPLPLGVVAIAFIVFETLAVYYTPESMTGVTDNVAHVAHIAGVTTGGLFAFFNNAKRSAKGLLVLGFSLILLLVLAPVFSLISGVASLILSVVDAMVGFVLYTISAIISRLLFG